VSRVQANLYAYNNGLSQPIQLRYAHGISRVIYEDDYLLAGIYSLRSFI